MSVLLLVGLLALNFGISWFNAWQCGRFWALMNALGGWYTTVLWAAVIMTGAGFTWCILICEVFLGVSLGLPPVIGQVVFEIGYVVLIFPVLAAGLVIMLFSWEQAFRNGGFVNFGVAIWNTYAEYQNAMDAYENLGDVLKHIVEFIGEFIGDTDKDRLPLVLVVILVVVALGGGIGLTWVLILKYGANRPIPEDLAEALREERGEGAR
jgi:hypothetical protein